MPRQELRRRWRASSAQVRARWPKTTIIVLEDSGFCRDDLMSWCEANDVHFVLGLARNPRLVAEIKSELAEARVAAESRWPARPRIQGLLVVDARQLEPLRRVIAKAEWTHGEANPRFIVTSLTPDVIDAGKLYEKVYCQRGEMENRIKECQLDLLADRMPAATMRANQLRLWFASMAYVLMCALRRIALAGTELARATCATIRLKLLKIGAQVTISVRRVHIAMTSACPARAIFAHAHARL